MDNAEVANEHENIVYVNTIDIFIDQCLDMLGESMNNANKSKKKLSFNDIKNIRHTIEKDISYEPIETFIENEKARATIKKIVNDYVIIYLFLSLSFTNDVDSMREIIVTAAKGNDIIASFLGSTSNISLIMQYSNLIIDILEILKHIDNLTKVDNIKHRVEAVNLINFLGYDYVDEYLIKDKNARHNILKIIIFRMIYLIRDKITIFKLIEVEELSRAEFTYIDIVDSNVEELDYATIDKLFANDRRHGMADTMYDMYISSYDQYDEKQITLDNKIQELFNKNIIIPVTDEFLRFHKNSERYEKNVGLSKIDPREKTNKKDNTKIRYIVTKINKLIDYYNIKRRGDKNAIEEVDKLLYPSMNYRKAVIINEVEELSIINKMLNQGKQVIENNEYYSDLVTFRSYPYINFKDFDRYGFSFKLNNTKLAIRYCNFEYKNPDTFPMQYNSEIQIRVAPKDTTVNMVGIAINPMAITSSLRNIGVASCVKLADTMQIEKNGYLGTIRALKYQIKNDVNFNKLLYWIFDREHDKVRISSYENLAALDFEEYFKFLIGKIYDELTVITYEKIIDQLNTMQDATIYDMKNAIWQIQNVLIDITDTTYYNDVLRHMYFNNILENLPNFDKNENKIPGLNSSLIKIPTYVDTEKKQHVILIKKKAFLIGEKEEEYNELLETAYCQHQITWNILNMYKKRDPNKFNQALSEFIKKYVTDNKDKEYICKSCHQYVDIKKYIYDSFSSNITNIVFAVSLEADLESVPEYEKYSKAIKNMDKVVEKTAYIAGIHYYVGSAPVNKYHRQDVIKYTIDLIIAQFGNFDTANINMRKERLESSNKLYGVSKELSHYFIFDMDNNLFTYSSKDTDKFKRYKINNILAYVIFMIICDLNHGQIMQLNYDKLVNYEIFDKFAINLFNGLYIRINNGNDVKPIINYKLLCYMIYYMSGMILKYNYWHIDKKIPTKANTINPLIQKSIIHTIIDLINSVLEINTRKTKHYVYELVATKFLNRLVNIYDDKSSGAKDTIERLMNISDKKIQIVNNKIKIKSKDVTMMRPVDDYSVSNQTHNFGYNSHRPLPGKYYIDRFVKKIMMSTVFTPEQLEAINKREYNKTLQKIYINYSDDGNRLTKLRTFNEGQVDIKKLVNHASNILKNELNAANEIQMIKNNNDKMNEIQMADNKESLDILKKQMAAANKDIVVAVDNLINTMERIIGPNINLNNNNIYLKKTVYIIDHDHLGNNRKEILTFFDDENRVEFKKDDKFFGADVLYYVDKSRNITVYYDAYELYLLGYKEMNKEYTKLTGISKYLKINHSIRTKLLLLGHSHINYHIDVDESDQETSANKTIKIVSDIIRKRIHNLKNIIKEFQSYIYQIKNKITGPGVNKIVKQFTDKFKNISYYEDGVKIFENWKSTIDEIYFTNLKSNISVEIQSGYLNANKMIKYNNNDNLILFYLIEQLDMFIRINQSQNKLIVVLALIINQLFDNYNIDELIYMNDGVRKYDLLVTDSYTYTDDTNIIDVAQLTDEIAEEENLTDEQKQQLEEQREDEIEEGEGMDTDINIGDDVDEGDEGMDMLRDADDAD